MGDLAEKVAAFQVNLDVFLTDLTGRRLHFPTLSSVSVSATAIATMKELLISLAQNFKDRHDSFSIP